MRIFNNYSKLERDRESVPANALERWKGVEPSAFSLGRRHSTAELPSHGKSTNPAFDVFYHGKSLLRLKGEDLTRVDEVGVHNIRFVPLINIPTFFARTVETCAEFAEVIIFQNSIR